MTVFKEKYYLPSLAYSSLKAFYGRIVAIGEPNSIIYIQFENRDDEYDQMQAVLRCVTLWFLVYETLQLFQTVFTLS